MNTLIAPINTNASATASWLNKVPEVTLSFWVIKIMCTTVGRRALTTWRSMPAWART